MMSNGQHLEVIQVSHAVHIRTSQRQNRPPERIGSAGQLRIELHRLSTLSMDLTSFKHGRAVR